MYRFWGSIIQPALEAMRARSIVEVGVGEGKNTIHLLAYCQKWGAKLSAIDPTPACPVEEWEREHGGFFTFQRGKSLDILPVLDDYDAILIDGDHNYFTITNELALIEKYAQKGGVFPLLFLHDTGWPYGRRDLYYSPQDIPDSYRHPYSKGGVPLKGERGMCMNRNLCSALYEGGPRNGVLTALEDFLKDTHEKLCFTSVPGFHGLGMLASEKLLTQHTALVDFLTELQTSRAVHSYLSAIEWDRTHHATHSENLQEEQKKLLGELTQKEEEQKKLLGKLTQKEADLKEVRCAMDHMTRTRSWRWTSPLRRLEASLRRFPTLCTQTVPYRVRMQLRTLSTSPYNEEYALALPLHTLTPTQLEESTQRVRSLSSTPLLSVIVPVFRPDTRLLSEAVHSVTHQTYTQWELILMHDGPSSPSVRKLLEELRIHSPERIHWFATETHGGISATTNAAAEKAQGEYLVLLDQDDLLRCDALERMASLLHREGTHVDLIYSDHDKIDTNGGFRYDPEFKPDWSPELLLSFCYVGHFKAIRRELFTALGGFRSAFDGAQDYDFLLRLSETSPTVLHIPKVLYHWRRAPGSTAASAGTKPDSIERGRRALDEALCRRGIPARAVHPSFAAAARIGVYRLMFDSDAYNEHVTIVIPTKNRDLLERCIRSIQQHTTYPHYDILVLHNGDPTLPRPASRTNGNIRWLHVPAQPFNFSLLCNTAAAEAHSPLILFLNDDTEVLHRDWLLEMVGALSLDSQIGAVGAKLLFPNRTVQHGGVILGLNGYVAGHANKLLPEHSHGYLHSNMVLRNYSAVTGACLLTRTALFKKVGGFDEARLPISFSDVDYCLRLRTHGYRVVFTPHATLLHHEGQSRQGAPDCNTEVRYFRSCWRPLIRHDPHYNPNLSLYDGHFHLRLHPKGRHILCITHNLNFEGAPLSLYHIAKGLQRRGYTVEVLAPQDGPLRSFFEEKGIPITLENYWRPQCVFARMDEFDAIIANTLLAFPFLQKFGALKPPTVWCIRESDRDHHFRTHTISTELFELVDAVVFPSEGTRRVYADLEGDHFRTIPNGIDLSIVDEVRRSNARLRTRRQLGIHDHERIVLSVGTICPRKGQKELVDAAAQLLHLPTLPPLRFLLVGAEGSGSYEREVRAHIRQHKIEQNVSLLPKTPDVYNYYAASDLFVCASFCEASPRVTLEAMAFGLPIVATNIYGIPEQLRDGIEALLIPPGDTDALTNAIVSLLCDSQKASRLVANARRRVETCFTEDRMVAAYESLLHEVCAA